MISIRKSFLLLLLAGCTAAAGSGEKPSKDDITAVMKKTWEHGPTSTRPATDITINSIRIGSTEQSNYKHQLDGIPKGVAVTHAQIDFTQHEHYSSGDRDVRRMMTALVYKDHFNEWAVMNTGVRYIQ
ncbi:MAG: hypothetical protein EOO11_09900 [Chitinophagaceae bacterium]|nr:MAG: hypothetical protein EOO11_09900 [Chitinophagaceae bacterium]